MKKIDKLVFGSFIGPFVLTLVVVDFILLIVSLIRYFDKIFGKGLGLDVYLELFAYFSISASPDAFPLAVLLSSIMTFGNLGEHSELTAIKSSGISLVRALVPMLVFVLVLTGFTFYFNTNLVPKVNLKTYSLLWDMRSKKPALDLREGVFYDGIPGYSIKVNEKIGDEQLKDIIIYDHTNSAKSGNTEVMLADSGRMYSFLDGRYLALELYDGIRYEENMREDFKEKKEGGRFIRDKFKSSVIRFDLSSFEMGSTDEKLFGRSRLVRTNSGLRVGVDSMHRDLYVKREQLYKAVQNTFQYHFLRNSEVPNEIVEQKGYYDSLRQERINAKKALRTVDSLKNDDESKALKPTSQAVNIQKSEDFTDGSVQNDSGQVVTEQTQSAASRYQRSDYEYREQKEDNLLVPDVAKEKIERLSAKDVQKSLEKFDRHYDVNRGGVPTNTVIAINWGTSKTRASNNLVDSRSTTIRGVERDQRKYQVTINQQIAKSFACLVMFLIGAPIGAIIKKGGIGLPVIISVIFFLIYYVLNTTADKLGKEGVVDPGTIVWMSNLVLLPFGLFFLRQARNDARLFEPDVYVNLFEKVRGFFKRKPQLKTA